MIRVLLTGGTGSFGRGFVRTLMADKSQDYHVRVFSRDEHKQREMRKEFSDGRVAFFIGDVRDRERLAQVAEGADWIVHAAALKQAPLGEIEPQEFIKTNVYGSLNVIDAALKHDTEKTLLISTDKAVEPINLYGATKMCAEKLFLQADRADAYGYLRFACTRYGNVAGTSGSLVPLLRNLPDGEPAPVTDPQATRFWINLPEANAFVLETMKLSAERFGGRVHLPSPLRSASVGDVVEAVRPGKPTKVIGLRPGDKLHELLASEPRISSDQAPRMTVEEIRAEVAA